MNRALWTKALTDAWRQLLASVVVLTFFSWLFVWLMSRFPVGGIAIILNLLPGFLEAMIGVPLKLLASPVGQLSFLYIDVVTLLVCVGWALGRGSDSVSGEIARGTMDMILSLPVWRVTVLMVPAVVTALGSTLLAASVHLGTMLGLACVRFEPSPAPSEFLPGTINLFCMMFCFTAITTLVSSWGRDRWATIGIAGGFFIFSLIIKLVARLWPFGDWLFILSFLSAFEPQRLILMPDASGRTAVQCDVTLLGLGLARYVAAAVVFSRRDIPGPR
ncbi:MAG: ABC transporter permease subunit [Thermoguttaceae bacterium]